MLGLIILAAYARKHSCLGAQDLRDSGHSSDCMVHIAVPRFTGSEIQEHPGCNCGYDDYFMGLLTYDSAMDLWRDDSGVAVVSGEMARRW